MKGNVKIKTFIFSYPIDDDVINTFIAENCADVVSLTFNAVSLHDISYNGKILNKWVEYIGVLIYKQN